MKSSFKLTLLVVLFVGTSCSDDSDLPLIGTVWTQISDDQRQCDNPTNAKSEICSANCEVVIFNQDGSAEHSSNEDLDYEIDGNKITLIFGRGEFVGTATYEIIGDVLHLNYGKNSMGCDFVRVYKGA